MAMTTTISACSRQNCARSLKVCLDCGHQQCFATCVQGCDTCCIYCANSWNPILKSDKHLQNPLKYLQIPFMAAFLLTLFLPDFRRALPPFRGKLSVLATRSGPRSQKMRIERCPGPLGPLGPLGQHPMPPLLS